jgi:hypothetical protein
MKDLVKAMPKLIVFVGLFFMGCGVVGCSKTTKPENPPKPDTAKTDSGTSDNSKPAPEPPANALAPASGRAVKTEMRNVLFHLTDSAAARLEAMSGELWPVGKNELVVFDDKTSFEMHVTNGTVSIRPEALANVLNDYVFAKSDAPLKNISIAIKGDRLIIKGKLHSKGDIPFETAGTLSVNGDGRLRVKTEKVKALHVPVKGAMGLLGIELASVVNTSKIAGIDTDKNDLLMDLGELLPPPHIRGKVTTVRLGSNSIVTTFGDGGKVGPPSKEEVNYMRFEGNRVQFGKLTMQNTDLTVLDMDPADPLDWDQDHYKEQLVEGYSKIKENFGLQAYVKDYGKLKRAPQTGAAGLPSKTPQ